MFGASVLVPILFKINPATVLLMNGVGTLIYIWVTKGKIPAFLGSSFAFILPVFVVMASQGYSAALGGFIAAGLVFMTVAFIIGRAGIGWLDYVFPPAAMGAIITIIPAALVVIAEHIGHLVVTGNICGRDFVKDPGLHRSLMGDGLSTTLSGLVGSVPTTT